MTSKTRLNCLNCQKQKKKSKWVIKCFLFIITTAHFIEFLPYAIRNPGSFVLFMWHNQPRIVIKRTFDGHCHQWLLSILEVEKNYEVITLHTPDNIKTESLEETNFKPKIKPQNHWKVSRELWTVSKYLSIWWTILFGSIPWKVTGLSLQNSKSLSTPRSYHRQNFRQRATSGYDPDARRPIRRQFHY